MRKIISMSWPQTNTTYYHAQLGLLNKEGAIKEFFCLLYSMAWIYDLWDGSLDKRKVRGLVPCCGQDGYLHLAKVPQHPIDLYR